MENGQNDKNEEVIGKKARLVEEYKDVRWLWKCRWSIIGTLASCHTKGRLGCRFSLAWRDLV